MSNMVSESTLLQDIVQSRVGANDVLKARKWSNKRNLGMGM
jgi:hypothetical protein